MLTKNEFVKAINAIKDIDEKLDNNIKDKDLRLSFCEYSLQDAMIELLESAMGIPVDDNYGSTISWWIYENDFGKNHWSIIEKDENDNETEIYLDTPEELYDYCVDTSIED